MHTIWYQKPASHWREALPLGNGFTAMMVYGGKHTEKICFNDGTLWSGFPKDYNNPKALPALSKVRELVFSEKNHEADVLCEKEMGGFYSDTFLPLGWLTFRLRGTSSGEYKRVLELSKGLHTVQTAGVNREAFSSNPDRVCVYRITSVKPFSMILTAKSKLHYTVCCDGALNLIGNAPDYAAPNYLRMQPRPIRYDEGRGMAFCLRAEIETDGKKICKKKKIHIQDAHTVTLYMVSATGFRGFSELPDTSREEALEKCKNQLRACPRDYEALRARHLKDFSEKYNRQDLSLACACSLPCDVLLKNTKKGGDLRPLSDLLYHFGKYMMLSGSREGGQPLNLQGQWNHALRPPWSSNYTVNINTQMNYWAASRCALSECLQPFVQMVWETMQNGKKTAKVNYGCTGFACNHNVDIWRKTPPVLGSCNYMFAPLCGVWLANEVYAHYKNGELEACREKVYEIVTEAARFANDFLTLHAGAYVSCPSASPENVFSKGKKRCKLDYASAFDMGLVRQVFQNTLEISGDISLNAQIHEKLERLYPFQNGPDGICEWSKHYDTPEKGHRHFSPLYAFYPGTVIGYYRDKQQRDWVEKLFQSRVSNSGQHIGWSAAWAMCLAARLRDSGTAEKVISDLLRHAVFKNLFCVHPPHYFQIDGNLGFVAGIHEMLLTEEDGVIELLPALPPAFGESGQVRGLIVNGAEISFQWRDGEVIWLHSSRPVTVLNRHLCTGIEIKGQCDIREEF